jgi:lipoprotein NlpD
MLAGCSGTEVVAPLGRVPARHAPPAQVLADVHRVETGETLYAIAWRFGLDYRDLAQWNAIAEPFTIYPGQVLRVTRPAVLPPLARAPQSARREERAPAPSPAPREERRDPQTSAPTPPRITPPVTRASTVAPASAARAIDERDVDAWAWPVRGAILGGFGEEGGKGIDIGGTRGAPVMAAAPGHVVYSGSGLRGYGKLIIVKHNKRYLSAYAHNDHLHAKEGDTVESGQRIADMGSTDSKVVKLHFEIRRDGQPVDPARYLPR